jgi:hypothetical protein
MSNVKVFLGSKPIHSNYNNSGRCGALIICRACSSVNDGTGHPATWNQERWTYCGRTTHHPFSGQQQSSQRPIQGMMASFAWLLSKLHKGTFKRPTTKICPHCMQRNCNLFSHGWQYVHARDKFCVLYCALIFALWLLMVVIWIPYTSCVFWLHHIM